MRTAIDGTTLDTMALSTADLDGLGLKLHIPDHKLMFKPCDMAAAV